jgi:hypothetical protein
MFAAQPFGAISTPLIWRSLIEAISWTMVNRLLNMPNDEKF